MSDMTEAAVADNLLSASAVGALIERLRHTNWGEAWHHGSFPLLSDRRVSTRINLLQLLALCAAATFALVSALGEGKISRAMDDQAVFGHIGELASDLRADVLTMQTLQEEFLRSRDPALAEAHRRTAAGVAAHLKELQALPMTQPVAKELNTLSGDIEGVNEEFEAVVNAETKLGLGESAGLRVALMNSVKAMEDELKVWPNLEGLWNKALGMRQAEKDFMLYGGTEHLGKFRKFSMEFDLKIDAAGLPEETATSFRTLLASYKHDMAAFAEATTELDGDTVELRGHMDAVKPVIATLFTFARDGSARASTAQRNQRTVTLRTTGMAGVISILSFFLASLVLSRSIVAPLRMIERTMRRLVDGETQVAVPGITRKDEIGDMARAVAVFKDNAVAMVALQKDHQDLMISAEETRRQVMRDLADQFEGTVKSIVETVHTGANGIAGTAERMAARSKGDGEHHESRSLLVAESAAKAHHSVNEARQAASDLSASIHEVAGLVAESAAVAEAGAGELEQVDRQVVELGDAARQIDTVLALINQIAHQTNMLALNATIEAARAGEAGRGFAVVADEVKHLAVETAQATGRIASQIEAIQQAASNTANTIGGIGSTLRRMTEITASVNEAMSRQAVATDRIDECFTAVSVDSSIVVEGVIGVTQSAAGYCGSAIRVLWDATDLATPANALRQEVEAFLSRVRC